MATKRKSDAGAKPQKRGRKKKDDYDSDLSDGADYVEDKSGKVEVLISGSDDLEPVAKLPEELLATYDKTPGKMLVAGLVTWDLTGRRDPKGKVTKIRPNLYTFHKFTDQMYRFAVSGPPSAHSILINMDRKAMTFGRNQFGQLGQPELRVYEKPTLVPALENMNIIQAACGRNHSLFLTEQVNKAQ